MLRESREKERHENLANVSKQIVSPEPTKTGYSLDASSQGRGGYARSNRPPMQGTSQLGLPPSGSPMKRKGMKGMGSSSNQGSNPNLHAVGKLPVKPPSNYGKGNRHVSQNKVAGGNKALPALGQRRLSRERSSDGIAQGRSSGGLAADNLQQLNDQFNQQMNLAP